jgi:hypothetical protein
MAKKTDGKQTEPAAQASGARRFRSNGRLFFYWDKGFFHSAAIDGRTDAGRQITFCFQFRKSSGGKQGRRHLRRDQLSLAAAAPFL